MMISPFDTLIVLVNQIRDLDMIQEWIDGARTASPGNQIVQLELDRQQVEIDQKRMLIELTMFGISSQN